MTRCSKALGMDPGGGDRAGQALRACAAAAGPGFPAGLKWTFLPKDHPGPIYLCVNADESEPGTFNNRILMEEDPHQVLEGIMIAVLRDQAHDGVHLPALRVRPQLPHAAAGDRRVLRGEPAGQEHPRQRLRPRHVSASRGRGLHLRRGDGADREPGRQAGLAADQAAVSGRRRAVPQADDREQRRNAGLRDAHPRPRRRLVQVDRRAAGPEQPARPGSYGPKLYCLSGHVEQAGLLRIAAGRHRARADRRVRRRRVEGPQGEGGRPRRHQHGLSDRKPNSIRRWTSTGPEGRLPGPGHRRGDRGRRPDQHGRRAVQQLPVLRPRVAAASARPAAKAPPG